MAGIDTPSTVSVQITSSMTSFTSEKRLQRNETISILKVSTFVFQIVFYELGNLRKFVFISLIDFFFSFVPICGKNSEYIKKIETTLVR